MSSNVSQSPLDFEQDPFYVPATAVLSVAGLSCSLLVVACSCCITPVYRLTFGNLALCEGLLCVTIFHAGLRTSGQLTGVSSVVCHLEAAGASFAGVSVMLALVLISVSRYHIVCDTAYSARFEDARFVGALIALAHLASLAFAAAGQAAPALLVPAGSVEAHRQSLHSLTPECRHVVRLPMAHAIQLVIYAAGGATSVWCVYGIYRRLREHNADMQSTTVIQSKLDSRRILMAVTIQVASPVLLSVPFMLLSGPFIYHTVKGTVTHDDAEMLALGFSTMAAMPIADALATVYFIRGYRDCVRSAYTRLLEAVIERLCWFCLHEPDTMRVTQISLT